MATDDEYIQKAMDLGLSLLQAKAYINLTKFEKTEIKKISKASGVARSDLYRIMPTLEKLGLAEKIIGNPTMYRATPINDGLSILLVNRRKQYIELEKKTSELIDNFHENASQDIQEDTSQFIITSERTLFRKRLEKCFPGKQTVDILLPAKGLNFYIFDFFQAMKRALKEGTKIRVITEKKADITGNKIENLKKNPLFEIQLVNLQIDSGVTIFDSKEVQMCISCEEKDVPSLYSNNPKLQK